MTQEEIFAAVDGYFNRHLDKAYWNNLPEDTRAGAVEMAFNDVSGQITGLTMTNITADSVAIKAVAEQAVFLARNYDSIAEGKITTSESAEGVSAGYTLLGSVSFGIAPRAASFIQHAKRLYFANSARIVRG